MTEELELEANDRGPQPRDRSSQPRGQIARTRARSGAGELSGATSFEDGGTSARVTLARTRGSQARGRATRARLLDAAERLFTRAGYDGTAMGDVASAAGVSVGTLYHHFNDKRALLLELIDRFGDRLAAQRRTDLDFAAFLGAQPRRAVERWLQRTHERLRARPSLYLVVLGLCGRDLEIRRRYQRVEQLAIERLTSLIEFGQRQRLVRQALDPHAAAFLIHHSFDMAMVQLFLRESATSNTAPALRGGAATSNTAPALRGGAATSNTAPALRGGAVVPDHALVLHELTELICRYALEEP